MRPGAGDPSNVKATRGEAAQRCLDRGRASEDREEQKKALKQLCGKCYDDGETPDVQTERVLRNRKEKVNGPGDRIVWSCSLRRCRMGWRRNAVERAEFRSHGVYCAWFSVRNSMGDRKGKRGSIDLMSLLSKWSSACWNYRRWTVKLGHGRI